MLQLVSKDLSAAAAKRLAELQKRVDDEMTFEEKAKRATLNWDAKSNSSIGKTTFSEVAKTLEAMCVSVEVCNYCEQNEANDIEHIYPKSLFPARAFLWENYLLACKQCNTAYKLDAFAVLDDQDELLEIPRGTEPPSQRGAFINPRTEDPSAFMLLNFGSFKFEPLPGLTKAGQHKMEKTVEILQLNDRDKLIEARRQTAIYCYQRLEMLSRILSVKTIAGIKKILSPYDRYLDSSLSVDQLKDKIREGFKKDIQTGQHPSVWYAIKVVMRHVDAKWAKVFDAVPEAVHW